MQGKRYKETNKPIQLGKLYTTGEAIAFIKGGKACKFDETIDVAIRLGVDPKQADQAVRGVIKLPHGTGKKVKVAVLAKGDKAKEAQDAGADVVGDNDLLEKIKEGWLEFDSLIATPDMMGLVGKLGSVLGPRGLMPNPKSGTVTQDVGKAVQDIKAGKIEFRAEKAGVVHAIAGKASFSEVQIQENISALMDAIIRCKPATAKGTYIRSVTVSTTMGPGIAIDTAVFG